MELNWIKYRGDFFFFHFVWLSFVRACMLSHVTSCGYNAMVEIEFQQPAFFELN